MKKLFYLFLGLWLVSCSDRQLAGDILAENTPPPFSEENEFKALIEQARWGNGEAFLKLAGCYREGKGVEKDLIGMISMEAQAESFGKFLSLHDLLNLCGKGLLAFHFHFAHVLVQNLASSLALALDINLPASELGGQAGVLPFLADG